jgi:hypothetical protein
MASMYESWHIPKTICPFCLKQWVKQWTMVNLLLDPQLRDWALFPLIVVTVLVQFVRDYIMKIMEAPKKIDVKDLRTRCGHGCCVSGLWLSQTSHRLWKHT